MGWKRIINRERKDIEYLSAPHLEQYFAALVLELNLRLLCDKSMEEEKLLWVENITITAYEEKQRAALLYRIRDGAGRIWDSLLKMCGRTPAHS